MNVPSLQSILDHKLLIPYIHVADGRASFEKALREGAEAMMPPGRVMEGVTVAIVRVPGGVPIGFSGP